MRMIITTFFNFNFAQLFLNLIFICLNLILIFIFLIQTEYCIDAINNFTFFHEIFIIFSDKYYLIDNNIDLVFSINGAFLVYSKKIFINLF